MKKMHGMLTMVTQKFSLSLLNTLLWCSCTFAKRLIFALFELPSMHALSEALPLNVFHSKGVQAIVMGVLFVAVMSVNQTVQGWDD